MYFSLWIVCFEGNYIELVGLFLCDNRRRGCRLKVALRPCFFVVLWFEKSMVG